MISKLRLDALADSVFAFAMTLLVLDLRLPEGFRPANAAALIAALGDLWGQALAYVISFFVLGLRWLGQAQPDGGPEHVSLSHARWRLVHLFFITCIPFSTMVVGRYVDFAPAIWLYAANMILSAMVPLWAHGIGGTQTRDRKIGLGLLIVSALMSVAISFVDPSQAMWAYLINAAAPWLRRGLSHPPDRA